MKPISVKTTVMLGALGLGGLAIVDSGVGLWGSHQIGGRLSYITENTVPSLMAITNIRGGVRSMAGVLGRHILAPTREATLQIDEELDRQIATVDQALADYEPLLSDEHERGLYNDVLQGWSAWKETLPTLRRESLAINTAEATAIFNGRQQTAVTALNTAIDALRAYKTEHANQQGQAGAAAVQQTQLMMGALCVIALMAAAGVVFLLRQRVLTPLASMTDAMGQLAAGDNTVVVPATRDDEIGQMAAAVQRFKDAAIELEKSQKERAAKAADQAHVVNAIGSGLKQLADGNLMTRLSAPFSADYEQLRSDFNDAMGKLQDAMTTIVVNSGAIRSGAGEISQAADDLSRRTEQQAASLEETAAALDEITATVRKTAESSKQANAVVVATRSDAEASGQVVRETVAAMGEIEKSSKQISQIIGVIDEISFQTNLLALNAGVEAARAGEAGRGFAVVASEVRALAQRSSEAAREIKSLISASSQHVETGVELVGEAGKALELIVSKVGDISGLVSEIAASAQEQSTALAEVNTAINQMDQVTQQNAAMVEESTAASHSLTHEAEELMGLISRFQTGAAPTANSNKGAAKPKSHQPITQQRQRIAQFASNGSAALKADDDWQEF